MGNKRSVAYVVAGLCLTSLFFSCSSTPSKTQIGEHETERYSINPQTKTAGLNETQYSVDSICSLTLSDDIAEIEADKVYIENGRIFILDTHVTKKLYVFDYKGNLKTIIGDRGNAKGEFIGKPNEFFVDSKNKLHVFDELGHKINVFNIDGTVDKVIETNKFFPHSLGLTSNDRYMMYFTVRHNNKDNTDEMPSSLLLLEQDCENYKSLMSVEDDFYCAISEHTFFQDGGKLSFIPCFSDSVIVFKNDTVEKVVSFDFGEKTFCKEMPEALTKDKEYSFMESYQGVLGINRYQETNSLIYIDYIYQDYGQYWLYIKKNKQVVNGSCLFEGINPYSYYCLNDKQIIAYVDGKTVKDFQQLYQNKSFQDNLKKSPKQMRDLIEGKIKAPALFFITIH